MELMKRLRLLIGWNDNDERWRNGRGCTSTEIQAVMEE
jgi:hypothetical protein